MEDVRSGNAPRSTETMAPAKTAKRCQAGLVSPAGTGVNQMPKTSANTPIRRSRRLSDTLDAVMAGLLPFSAAPRRRHGGTGP